ncbi:hypothetical protein [Actinocorallia populi]|uniref:hypothetical protein n=1 Tax=Actinocorallia populi TaxID=2079200 RepID=UPI0013004641|nr:hypothetical protein [Actinocorallia populi]
MEAVASAEVLVGYPMPMLLKRIYLEVADGRFDDRASALSLRGAVIRSHGAADWKDLPDEVPDACVQGPAGVVPLRFWGCSVWTHVDWRTPEGRLWGEDEGYVYPEKFTLAERLVRWMDGHEDFPVPLRERGRRVWIDGADDDGWHFTGIRSLDDDKVWKVIRFQHGHKDFPRGTAATIVGPLPGGGHGETEVVLTHQPQQDWWWMDLDLP